MLISSISVLCQERSHGGRVARTAAPSAPRGPKMDYHAWGKIQTVGFYNKQFNDGGKFALLLIILATHMYPALA